MEGKEEILKSESQQENVNDSIDYIEAIKEMKQNSVDREAYDKLKAENKKLLQSLINGETINQETPKKEIDVNHIEQILSTHNNHINSLEGFKMALDLREADLAAGKPDPFLPLTKRQPTQADLDACENRAQIYRECIEYADGDAALFAQELSRRMIDVSLPKRK